MYGYMLIDCGNIVVRGGYGVLRTIDLHSPGVDPGKCLWTSYFMDQVLVDIQHTRATLNLLNYVCIPYFVK
jgi:hypothetical protein